LDCATFGWVAWGEANTEFCAGQEKTKAEKTRVGERIFTVQWATVAGLVKERTAQRALIKDRMVFSVSFLIFLGVAGLRGSGTA
jgi:hypothetical protein